MNQQRQKQVKRLQDLYSWSEFYQKNQRKSDFDKTQVQITDFKKKYKFD